ncbi:MAG: septum formation protein Maf [Clostridia bacterium]|nr:septum formation protein Maf [Clostridia bacterium]
MELILASASQRRRELMTMCGYEFTCIPSAAEEDEAVSDPAELVKRLSLKKAEAVFRSLPEERRREAVIVGSDTVVVLDGEIIGKPKDPDDAFRMLRRESGRANTVYTGLAVVRTSEESPDVMESSVVCDEARVRFAELTDEEIAAYIATGDPLDKAGAYGIQGCFSMFIEGIEGSYFTVVGLPVHILYRELRRFGAVPKGIVLS